MVNDFPFVGCWWRIFSSVTSTRRPQSAGTRCGSSPDCCSARSRSCPAWGWSRRAGVGSAGGGQLYGLGPAKEPAVPSTPSPSSSCASSKGNQSRSRSSSCPPTSSWPRSRSSGRLVRRPLRPHRPHRRRQMPPLYPPRLRRQHRCRRRLPLWCYPRAPPLSPSWLPAPPDAWIRATPSSPSSPPPRADHLLSRIPLFGRPTYLDTRRLRYGFRDTPFLAQLECLWKVFAVSLMGLTFNFVVSPVLWEIFTVMYKSTWKLRFCWKCIVFF